MMVVCILVSLPKVNANHLCDIVLNLSLADIHKVSSRHEQSKPCNVAPQMDECLLRLSFSIMIERCVGFLKIAKSRRMSTFV